MTPKLATRNLTKRFGDFTAVREVSLEFSPGRIHAILGENGAGKSTLMRLLFGLQQPTSGEILIADRVVHLASATAAIDRGLGMVQQHFTLVETLSAIDNIMLGAEITDRWGRLDRRTAIRRMEGLLPSPHLSVPWNAPVSEFSVGQKQRVEILKLLFRDARVLVLDEPTAVLTPAEIEDFFAMLKKLKGEGRSVILITHKIGEVMRLCDTFAILRAGQVVAQGEVAAVTPGKIIEHMIGRPLPEFALERPRSLSRPVLLVDDVRGLASGLGEARGLTLHVNAGEVVGVAGVEGSGQGALVDAVMGLSPFLGQVEICGQAVKPSQVKRVRDLGVGLVPGDRLQQGLWLEESCHTNMMIGLEDGFTRYQILEPAKIESTTALWARDFDVRAYSLRAQVGSLSGGNQQKVVFARELSGRKPKLLICHHPTRGVDLGAMDLIHRKLIDLRNQGVGILVLSSELDELTKLCDRIYVLFAGKVASEFGREHFAADQIGAAMTGVARV